MLKMTNDILLGEAIRVAQRMGWQVCFDTLDGVGSSPVTVKGERWVVLDRQQPSRENLAQLVRVLDDSAGALPDMSDELSRLIRQAGPARKAA